jgi:hypothetical protein
MDRLLLFLLALALLSLTAPDVQAQLITTSYQGYLEQNGAPVNNPSATLTFRLYRTPNGGSPLWTETKTGVAVTDGVFNVALGSQVALQNTLFDGLLFLSVAVGGGGAPQLSPRTVFRSVPYARTLSAPARVTGAAPADGAVLRVENTAALGSTHALWGVSSAVSGVSTGVLGESASPFGIGLYGIATAATGLTTGVWGYSASDQGTGVFGAATGSASGQTYGVRGLSSSTLGIGVQGDAMATSGYTVGVWGQNASTEGAGVLGQSTSTSGFTNGVRGISYSLDGHGVHGVNVGDLWECFSFEIEPCGIGVYGEGWYAVWGEGAVVGNGGVIGITESSFASAVRGHGDGEASTGVRGYAGYSGGIGVEGISGTYELYGYGVYGVSYDNYDGGNGLSAAIYGRAAYPDVAWAGYFEGDINVEGTLSKGGGSFQIDHPLDPENRVLRHSFVESPDMMNVYNGNVTTDARGYATVALSDYFEALNRDFRYQLTVIGQTFAQAVVAEEVRGNRFVIRTSEPDVRVSWQVTGIRQDAWADENRIVVEEDKKPEDRGLYLHPAAFGLPRERWVHYDPVRAAAEAQRLEERTPVEEGRARRQEARKRREAAERARQEAERMHREAPAPPLPPRPAERDR